MFSITHQRINASTLSRSLANSRAGALVTFEGWVRNHDARRKVRALGYECFEPLAKTEGEKILAEAAKKFDILGARCVHRVGKLRIGELSIWIGVCSAHRAEAFAACRYVIEEIKKRLPIWKKEFYADDDSGWVNCQTASKKSRKRKP